MQVPLSLCASRGLVAQMNPQRGQGRFCRISREHSLSGRYGDDVEDPWDLPWRDPETGLEDTPCEAEEGRVLTPWCPGCRQLWVGWPSLGHGFPMVSHGSQGPGELVFLGRFCSLSAIP